MLTLADKVRARIAMHGGQATASQILPYVNATAAAVKALPGITFTLDRSKVGRPATVYTLTQADSSSHSPRSRPLAQREENRTTTVVRLDTYRPAPLRAPEVPKHMKQPRTPTLTPAPVTGAANPFLSLI
ncbi:hypothetical protein ACIRPK_26070 [Kitasatospora sp. NPDC101801]|uniref:hypothetical protein n=1 Tax=Kitasatospora sp. NPDC101801 TaxID=3364103 RepID=UPI00381AB2D3